MLACVCGDTDTVMAVLNLAMKREGSKLELCVDMLRLLQQHLETEENLVLHSSDGVCYWVWRWSG